MTTLSTHRTGGATGANGYGEYKVRYASDKQQLFIKTLLETKTHSFGDVDVAKLNVQGAGELITKLLALPTKVGVVIAPSEKQVSFANALIKKKEGGVDTLNHYLHNRKVSSLEELDRKDVSEIINALKFAKEITPPIKITNQDVGAYIVDEVVYSIREGRESKKLQVWSYEDVAKKYVRDLSNEKEVLSKVELTDRLTLEKAIKYSAQTGICCHCGRTLTVLKSVAGGIGPICAKRYN
jgi:hypothetical protein